MSVAQIASICRGCLSTKLKMVNTTLYETMFKDLTGIIISPSDGLPQWFCYECIALLQKCNRFRNKIMKSHYLLCQYVLEGVPFARDELEESYLTQTSLLHVDIRTSEINQVEQQIDTKVEDLEIKEEADYSDYGESCAADPFDELASVLPAHDSNEEQGSEQEQEKRFERVDEVNPLSESERTSEQVYECTDAVSALHREDDEADSKDNTVSDGSVNGNVSAYVCDECNKRFDNKILLITHIHEHANTIVYHCDKCKKTFINNDSFEKHCCFYKNKNKYKCNVCMKCFASDGCLKRHRPIHTGDKPFKCEVCMKCFARKSTLDVHHRIHTDHNLYRCNVCMKRFSRKSIFHIHCLKHTTDRPYKCEICSKGFTCSSTLLYHRRIHTGDKPFECDICLKCFGRKGTLEEHRRIHTGYKPFKCDVCMKYFRRKHALDDHRRIHTGENPYKCNDRKSSRRLS